MALYSILLILIQTRRPFKVDYFYLQRFFIGKDENLIFFSEFLKSFFLNNDEASGII